MAKYSYEFKLMVVKEYLNGEGGYPFLCKKHNIPDVKTLYKWVSNYNSLGPNGLMRSRKKQTYTFDFKLHVVELYLTREVSYQELANELGLNNPAMLCKWVNDYRDYGPNSLMSKPKGQPPTVKKSKKDKDKTKVKEDNQKSDYLKQLEEENLKLKIENAYLKELRRLRLEGTPQKKRQE